MHYRMLAAAGAAKPLQMWWQSLPLQTHGQSRLLLWRSWPPLQAVAPARRQQQQRVSAQLLLDSLCSAQREAAQ